MDFMLNLPWICFKDPQGTYSDIVPYCHEPLVKVHNILEYLLAGMADIAVYVGF